MPDLVEYELALVQDELRTADYLIARGEAFLAEARKPGHILAARKRDIEEALTRLRAERDILAQRVQRLVQ